MSVLNWIFNLKETATVPSMDGALRPNQALDEAEMLATADAPDNLVLSEGRILFSSGPAILALGEGDSEEIRRFETDILAMAVSPDAGLAVALKDGGILITGGLHDGVRIDGVGPKALKAVTSLAFDGPDTLLVAIGSERHEVDDWPRDLLEGGCSGSVWQVPLGGDSAQCIAGHLGYPSGVLADEGRVIVSEAWRHRLIGISASAPNRVQPVLDDLPGYPGRLTPCPGGGAWLSVFAPRNQLIEFVLREDAFRRQMMKTMDKEYWIAPTLRAGKSFKEPMQVGAVKTLGVHKPWAPTRSYGLAVRLGPDFTPAASLHSRADGRRHGVTSCLEHRDGVIVTCRGDGVVIRADGNEDTGRAA